MAVLALDLGLTFGWCTWRRGDVIASGYRDLEREDHRDGVRFLAFRQWLTAKKREIEAAGEVLEDVVYEQVDFIPKKNGVYAAHVYGALWGNLESWCRFYGLDPIGMPVATVKKHVTGHGSAAKPLVTKRIKELFPHVRQPDEADAVAVLITAKHKHPYQGTAA